MQKISPLTLSLAVLLVIASGFKAITKKCFTGYQLYFFTSSGSQPPGPIDPCSLDQYGQFADQSSTEYDLDAITDPTPEPGDELCAPSSEICVAQVRIQCDECDLTYGVDFRPGTFE